MDDNWSVSERGINKMVTIYSVSISAYHLTVSLLSPSFNPLILYIIQLNLTTSVNEESHDLSRTCITFSVANKNLVLILMWMNSTGESSRLNFNYMSFN